MSGSVSCKCETSGEGTSNASTTTRAYGVVAACESVFFSPVTSIVNVWLLLVRSLALKTGTWISYDLANISTWDTKTPSTNTRAIPLSGPRMPIHVTAVPVKVNVACAPAVMDSMAFPPLHANQPVSRIQPGLKPTDGSV